MECKEYIVKQCKANDLECILLYRLLCIPDYIMQHSKFRRLIIVKNPISNKIRIENNTVITVNHYCSIDIDDKIENVQTIFKNHPFFMDYNIFIKETPQFEHGSYIGKIYNECTHLIFWIPDN